MNNIIDNYNFSNGVHSWHVSQCDAFISVENPTAKSWKHHVVVTNRTENWQGLEQDITHKVSSGSTYTLCASVGVSGTNLHGGATVIASLKLEYQNSDTMYMNVARATFFEEKWEKLDGKFTLSDKPDRVTLYFEGPNPGINILIESVLVFSHKPNDLSSEISNIIDNHNFSNGLHSWHVSQCHAFVSVEDTTPKSWKHHVVVTNRTDNWQGLEQDITHKVSSGSTYTVCAHVGVSGSKLHGGTTVIASIKLLNQNLHDKYMNVARTTVSDEKWEILEGKFTLSYKPDKVVFYLEGPNAGVNILVKSVLVLSHKPNGLSNEMNNIIDNPNFSNGLHSWDASDCHAFVSIEDTTPKSCNHHVVVTNRTDNWQGLEQDITHKVSSGSTYMVCARVGVSGRKLHSGAEVVARIKLEYQHSETQNLNIASTKFSQAQWKKLEGIFTLSNKPDRVMFCLDGPNPGVNILIESVLVLSYKPNDLGNEISNIMDNHNFSIGLHSWHASHCDAFVSVEGSIPESWKHHAIVTNRTKHWQGLEQEITNKISSGSTYTVCARVVVSGNNLHGAAEVNAGLRLEYQHSDTKYLNVARTTVSEKKWKKLQGKFMLLDKPNRVVFYLEGPNPGVNILLESVSVISHGKISQCLYTDDANIILNPDFEDGVNNWSGRGCNIVTHDSMGDGKIIPKSGRLFASTSERTQSWNGIQQNISGKVQRKLAYEVIAFVRIYGNNVTSSIVHATLWVQTPDSREHCVSIAKVQATDSDWVQLQGKFLLNGLQSKVVVYLEGPPSGTDILVDGFILKRAEKTPPSLPPVSENPDYGVNIVTNSNLSDGTNRWFPLGNCVLSVVTGSPCILPLAARDTLGPQELLSGRCIHATNRTDTWMGPAQSITDKVKLFVTYQVSAWVWLGSIATGRQNVNVVLGIDNQWVNRGQIEITDANQWHEICGSFRIEKQPAIVTVAIQGPTAGVSFKVAGLHIFAVDRQARFRHLKRQTDKIRKQDVTLKFPTPDRGRMQPTVVTVKQIKNSFPIGSCISRTNIDNEDFVAFFVKHFNWAVFENELKWDWTESQKGKLNYQDADDLLKLCDYNNISARGHCIFSDVDEMVQDWVKNLNKTDLDAAVQNRLTSLLNRYKGKFKHYDVCNEMLHGSFYLNQGQDIRASMFKTANQLDPSTILFVNDYHVEDGCDPRSTPERYMSLITDLQQQGAPVGGIGIQGHINSPVGPIVCLALDKLGTLGLPIWFTELDVSSVNEHIRADDLEVMLREAYAHPAVEGIMIWGFWELLMSRDNSHLVNAEGDINEAGNRLLELKKEWLSHTHGHVDDNSEFKFRGYPGTYEVIVVMDSKETVKKFVVEKGDVPLMVPINP